MNTNRRIRKGARRRVRTRTALFLYACSLAGLLAVKLLSRRAAPGLSVWLGAAGMLLCFALPAFLGLSVIDGDQCPLLKTRRISGAQALWLCVSGALLVCPATLLGDIGAAFYSMIGVPASTAQGSASLSLLLPVLFASGVLAPVCEEVFFRGYLLGVLSRRGEMEAALLTALLFAAAHGMDGFLTYFLLGLLFAAVCLRAGSVLAPVMMHMAYNVTLIVLSATPVSLLFTGLSPLSCFVRLGGCAALFYALQRLWRARGTRQEETSRFSARDLALPAAAAVLVILSQVFSGVLGL